MEFTRCLRCMQVTEHYPCPHCGYAPGKVPAQPHALRPGVILNGKYVVGTILGQGGFGITYIGWDLALESKVAIKEYFPSGQVVRSPENSLTLQWYTTPQAEAARNAGREMFLKEARKMSRVGSIPQVVRVRDLFQENDTAYIVMDYVEGETLMARLKKAGPLSWEQAQAIFLPAIRAMEQVHQEGLIHRDLSPDNLMLLPNRDVRILDLGAAKDLTINSGASSMQVAKGGFSPLEQYTQRGGSGTWSDVYAMAATMYYSLTGVLPPASVDRVESDTIRWDLPALTSLPKPVLDALKKAMAVFVKDRTQTMGVFLSALESTNTRKRKARKKKKSGKKRYSLIFILLTSILLAVFSDWVGYESPQVTLHSKIQQKEAESYKLEKEELRQQQEQTKKIAQEKYFDTSSYTGVSCNFEVTYLEEPYDAQTYNCTLYDLGNGQTKIVVEYYAPRGDSIVAWALNEQGTRIFRWDAVSQTSGKQETIAFDFPTYQIANVDVISMDVGSMWIQIDPTPNPIGEPYTHWVYFEKGRYAVHSLTSQELDNGFVRFTMDFTVPKGRKLSFEAIDSRVTGNWIFFEKIEKEIPIEGRQTLVWDVPRESLVSANYIRVELYRPGDTNLENHDLFEIPSYYWQ